jgi:hypothetical protein
MILKKKVSTFGYFTFLVWPRSLDRFKPSFDQKTAKIGDFKNYFYFYTITKLFVKK